MAEVRGEEEFWKAWPGLAVFSSRLLWSAVVWYLLAGGEAESWIVGVPAVLAAAALSAFMLPALRWSPAGAVRFWAFFLLESLRGGIDVARRAMHWRLPLDPGIVRHRSRMSRPAARVSVVNTTGLLPGTLVLDLDPRHTWIHALDAGQEIHESLVLSEERVADLFGLELEAPEQDQGIGGAS